MSHNPQLIAVLAGARFGHVGQAEWPSPEPLRSQGEGPDPTVTGLGGVGVAYVELARPCWASAWLPWPPCGCWDVQPGVGAINAQLQLVEGDQIH